MAEPISVYPVAIDGYAQLPLVVDEVTEINAASVNPLRSAIVNIESELGINPSGSATTVSARLDLIEANLGATSVDTVTVDTLLTSDNAIVLVDASSGAIIITLPDASSVSQKFDIKKIDSSANTVTINTAILAQTIDGSSSILIDEQNASFTIVSNGTDNYFII